uniref:Probable ATP-dependent transporter ycf16 n=1 Tax=Hildenbrandia rivularis TaxID=135206 RepID=A0A1C9CFB8_9FLOR|nr:iron-sulfur cluster formation ABC transporter ATP-binding subunit [Hildenbrandia rivularis]AOM67108.1 iron-sulfur cluster formation ABC transporter ATP-binding subunit [Hildenbrandia rivularis]
MEQEILKITELSAEINGIKILKRLNLTVKSGEIHAIMGPNGSGKSTLAKIIVGHPSYKITEGSILFNKQNIVNDSPEDRACKGVFLAFQYPIEIPGVSNVDFLQMALNSQRRFKNLKPLDPLEFLEVANKKLAALHMDSNLLYRNVNEGFSGGEKKRNEILQMALFDSQLSILDETDSGLDIDALKIIASAIKSLSSSSNSIIMITHYDRLLQYVVPDFVHVMQSGKIVKTGDSDLARQLEKHGYKWVEN